MDSEKPEDDESLNHIFGRIVSHPEHHNGEPYLEGRNILVRDVIDLMIRGLPLDKIRTHFKNQSLSSKEISSCRAYQASFMPETIQGEMKIKPDDQPIFLLDENVSHHILFDVARNFGRSSHVRAEGLHSEFNDDEKCIWSHAIKNKYQAVMTSDSDFKRISKFYRNDIADKFGSIEQYSDHIPSVLMLPKIPSSPKEILDLLKKHQQAIREFLDQKGIVFAQLTEEGLILPPYSNFDGKKANKQSRPSPRPSPGPAL
jgi:uncharacterized protein (DUF433 family)/predicted nuclease of predicted toxin-antitoxin system